MPKYIGGKLILSVEETDQLTPGGVKIVQVVFEDGSAEYFSSLLYEKIQTDEPIDASALRDKRVFPMVEAVLAILRDWGARIGELPYFSAVLNQSLDFNHKEALRELWSQWGPKPESPEDVDLVTMDRVLSTVKKDDKSAK